MPADRIVYAKEVSPSDDLGDKIGDVGSLYDSGLNRPCQRIGREHEGLSVL